ncbi:hypothetical protein CW745_01415 [Psychromonas sp. psych-6C06]|uniref:MmcQ/YjbR family DNA-binding protein n=1 Tax=Psychromonas sp. psych-6C06 TaxID=2058089 RepID=UPI000C3217C0|nr:MmcQ/YjbR family DNA-binding protein [Psychromonas sp. psych-6C06]PKF63538.1 hypothetical protein CW745_01415 [Psychromonas sp. psych-6C06]
MNYEEFNQYCGSFAATSYVVQWGNSHVWKVAGKVFAIGGWGKDKQLAFTFKTSEQNYYFLSECEGYIPAPYFANRGMKWIQLIDNSKDEDLKYYLSESYRLVSLGLSKSKQKELGLNQKK